MRILPRRRHIAVASLLALLITGATAVPASAQGPDDVVVASGEDWTVERAPGGYTVTLRLAAPLPIVSDAPTIVVDGEPLGIARTEDGGRTLTITTFDDRVASAREVVKGGRRDRVPRPVRTVPTTPASGAPPSPRMTRSSGSSRRSLPPTPSPTRPNRGPTR